MEFFIVLLLVCICIYPYILILRLLQLACKALKKYLKSDNVYLLNSDEKSID